MYKQEKKYYRNAFLIALIMALVLLLPFVILDGGYFIFYGDYNAQQIPFYKLCSEAVKNGNFGWSWKTDLGANFIGSYSFYTLGSPFFWFAALFPAAWSQYFMAPLLALKIALSSLFAFIYIRRFVSKPQTALIGGILYAFSSFSMYNIFFNHFHEAICFAPLMLIGLEEAMVNKRKGVFALAVALNAFVNYFFFIGDVIFIILYFLVRYACDKKLRLSLGDFFCLAFESVVGVMMACALFVPAIYQVLGVPRSTSTLSDWSFLFYTREQRYGLLLEGMFFPPEIPARSYLFPDAGGKWSSVALYLPLFSMAGVIAFVKGAKGHWARTLLPLCAIFAFIPGFNAMFSLFNSNFYTRWFYMPELICCLATVYVLEHDEFDLRFGFKLSAVIPAVMIALTATAPFTVKDKDGKNTDQILPAIMHSFDPYVWIMVAVAVLFLGLLWFLVRSREKLRKERFMKRALALTIACCLGMGYYYVAYGRIIGPGFREYNDDLSADIHIDDMEFYRMEGPGKINNINMLWGMSSLKSFTSIIPNSTFELYDLLNIERSVNSAPELSNYGIRALTRVKYMIRPAGKDDHDQVYASIYNYSQTIGDYDIFETEYALPMGFTYDTYILEETMANDALKKINHKDNILLRSVVLTAEQAEKYADLFTEGDELDYHDLSITRFKEDALERIKTGVSRFSVGGDSFSALCNYEDNELVVFSVPYDDGWSAFIDGESVEIEKVNAGFMALYVPAGEHNISFEYKTPGLKLGLLITAAGFVLFGLYMAYWILIRKYKARDYIHLDDVESVRGIKAHKSYIRQLSGQIYNSPEKTGGSRPSEEISWPHKEEDFMDTGTYNFSVPTPKDSAPAEPDEADRVMEELDRMKQEDNNDEP